MPDVSKLPIVAPHDYESRPETTDVELGSRVRMGGRGWPTDLACGACGNTEGNLQILHSWWCGHSGDAVSNDELRCAKCRLYTLYITSH